MNKCHQKSFGLKYCCVQKIWVKQNFGPKNEGSQKIGPKKFGQNCFSNSRDIPDMDKCLLDSWYKLKMVSGTYF